MPKRFLQLFPDALVDVYELDPAVVEVGHRYFSLPEIAQLRSISGDARHALQATTARYDFVFGDAYNGVAWIPFHLTTKEFYQLVASRLTERGVYMSNIVSALGSERSTFLYATLKTLGAVFEHVHVYAGTAHQNVILVASQKPLSSLQNIDPAAKAMQLQSLTQHFVPASRYAAHVSSAILLTDDHAPVEAMLGGLL
jgi:spermidine synthase